MAKKAKKAAKKVRNATPLNAESIVETIKAYPANLRRYATKLYRKVKAGRMPRRHGSDHFARTAVKSGKPKLAVTPKERRAMTLEYANGGSYRCVEETHGLYPCSGMDAYRCINGKKQSAILADKSGKFAKKIAKLCRKNGQTIPEACKDVLGEDAVAKIAAAIRV